MLRRSLSNDECNENLKPEGASAVVSGRRATLCLLQLLFNPQTDMFQVTFLAGVTDRQSSSSFVLQSKKKVFLINLLFFSLLSFAILIFCCRAEREKATVVKMFKKTFGLFPKRFLLWLESRSSSVTQTSEGRRAALWKDLHTVLCTMELPQARWADSVCVCECVLVCVTTMLGTLTLSMRRLNGIRV